MDKDLGLDPQSRLNEPLADHVRMGMD
ncbi:hypothetical protein NQ317_011046 [Molorchus minor]|uniref:Uncharacterized protein n=1 Tax=Molorchus minor TaxID=1323400 RepID=A0ABQ9J5V0_9CUCU|nr:hypothetical protein NQ317_011046 [Molorchus minor]